MKLGNCGVDTLFRRGPHGDVWKVIHKTAGSCGMNRCMIIENLNTGTQYVYNENHPAWNREVLKQ